VGGQPGWRCAVSGRREHRGRHEPLVITIRRPRARVALARADGELIMAALADAAGYREWRARQRCERCDAEPEGACEDHLHDGAMTGAYRALAIRLAGVLPEPPGGGDTS
jgi:hypothetical protein